MRVLKKIVVALVVLVALLVAVGLLLPRVVHVERSAFIAAPPCTVFALVNGFGRFNEWSPWAQTDPETRYGYEGPRFGVGARMTWESEDPNVGVGSQEIVTSEPWSLVRTKLDFGSQGTADAFFRLEEQDGGAAVTWGFDTDFGMDLMGRYFGLFFESWIGKDYEKGLAGLAELAEAQPDADWCDLDAEIVATEASTIAFASGSSGLDPEEIGAAMGAAYGEVLQFLGRHGLEQAGPPLAINSYYDRERGYGFDAAIAVAAPAGEIPEGSAVRIGATWAGTAVRVTHLGPYTGLAATHEKLEAYRVIHGLEAAERSWYEFVSDPGETPEEELVTRIFVPVK